MASITLVVDDIHTHADLVAIVGANGYSIGKLPSKENRDYPWVAWVPTDGVIGTTEHIGGRLVAATRQRQRRTAHQNFSIHCWAATIALVEDLRDAVIIATLDSVSALSGEFGAFEWVTQQPGGADYAARGEKLVMQAAIDFPVADPIKTLVVITAQNHTHNFENAEDGSSEQVYP